MSRKIPGMVHPHHILLHSLVGVVIKKYISFYLKCHTDSSYVPLTIIYAGGLDLRLYYDSNLKTYLLTRWLGPDALALGLPVGFFCSGIQFYVLLSPYLCFISFYILIYMFLVMMH